MRISRQLNSTFIITPKVASFAAQYFNCLSYLGLELENEGLSGSIGSHWETRMLADDVNENKC